jgi:hypothetical protein
MFEAIDPHDHRLSHDHHDLECLHVSIPATVIELFPVNVNLHVYRVTCINSRSATHPGHRYISIFKIMVVASLRLGKRFPQFRPFYIYIHRSHRRKRNWISGNFAIQKLLYFELPARNETEFPEISREFSCVISNLTVNYRKSQPKVLGYFELCGPCGSCQY